MTDPLISLVCSTMGRPVALKRLLDSLAATDGAASIEFILVDQSESQECAQLLRDYQLRGPWAVAWSGPGVSVGRNVGIGVANAAVPAFPDDNCWYAPDTILEVLAALAARPDLAGVSGKQLTAGGQPSALRWRKNETLIGRTNFTRTSISSTLFLRRSALPSAAPFDEGLGVGSSGWRGAGEESDLLLRLIGAGHRVAYMPEIHVYKDDPRDYKEVPRDEFADAYIAKALKYGVGIGHLWRRHRLSKVQLTYHSARKVVGSGLLAARGERTLARSQIAYVRGMVAGWRGVSP